MNLGLMWLSFVRIVLTLFINNLNVHASIINEGHTIQQFWCNDFNYLNVPLTYMSELNMLTTNMLNSVKNKIGNEKSQDVQRGLKSQFFLDFFLWYQYINMLVIRGMDFFRAYKPKCHSSNMIKKKNLETVCNAEICFQCFDTKTSFKDQGFIQFQSFKMNWSQTLWGVGCVCWMDERCAFMR